MHWRYFRNMKAFRHIARIWCNFWWTICHNHRWMYTNMSIPYTKVESSIVNEGIRALLNLFIFLLQEDFTWTKSTKCIQENKNKKDSIFMHIKTSKVRKVACSLICVFVIFMVFVLFVLFCMWNKKDSIFIPIKNI